MFKISAATLAARPLATIELTERVTLYSTVYRESLGHRTIVVLADDITASEAYGAALNADEATYEDFLLMTDDGSEYLPDFVRGGWVNDSF